MNNIATAQITTAYNYFREMQELHMGIATLAGKIKVTDAIRQESARIADEMVAFKFGFTIKSLFV